MSKQNHYLTSVELEDRALDYYTKAKNPPYMKTNTTKPIPRAVRAELEARMEKDHVEAQKQTTAWGIIIFGAIIAGAAVFCILDSIFNLV